MNRNSEIAKIAYELYIRRQGAPGDSQTDWFIAERIFAERHSFENLESPFLENGEAAPPAVAVKRARVRAKSNGSSQPATASDKSLTKPKVDNSATEKAPRKKRSTTK